MARYSNSPLGPPIRPAAWVSWYKEYSPLTPRVYDAPRHALVIVGQSAVRYWGPAHFLPTQLALENASVERFIDISYLERINPATQLAIFDNCKLADLNNVTILSQYCHNIVSYAGPPFTVDFVIIFATPSSQGPSRSWAMGAPSRERRAGPRRAGKRRAAAEGNRTPPQSRLSFHFAAPCRDAVESWPV